jgi:hypothetical protein
MFRHPRWARPLVALAALAVSSAPVVVLAAPAHASAVITTTPTVVWQNSASGGASWVYQPAPGCAPGSCYFQSSMRNLFSPSATGNVTLVTVSAFGEYGPLAPEGSIEIRTADNYPSDSSTLISASTSVVLGSDGYSEVYTMSPATLTAGTQYELIERATDASLNFIVNWGGSGLSGNIYTGNSPDGVGAYYPTSAGIAGSVTMGPVPLSASLSVNPSAPNGLANWYTAAPTVTVTCAGGDPATDCPAPATVADGVHLPILGSVHNAGGETATYTGPALQVDTLAPTATPVITGTLGSNGWYTSTANVSWNCADATSGVATCPSDSSVTDADLAVAGTTSDVAGNSAPVSLQVKSDTIAPTITGQVTTTAAADGKYDSSITVHWTCADAGSGISACPADTVVTGLGADTVAAATVHDIAGNSATGTVSGLVRHPVVTPPAAGGAPTTPPISVTEYVLHGLPAKFRSGKAVLAAGATYHLAVTTLSGQGSATAAPQWLRAVKTNAAGTAGKPTVVSGSCHVTGAGAYSCTFVVTKAMRGSFRKFGLLAPDGTVTYKTVYVR